MYLTSTIAPIPFYIAGTIGHRGIHIDHAYVPPYCSYCTYVVQPYARQSFKWMASQGNVDFFTNSLLITHHSLPPYTSTSSMLNVPLAWASSLETPSSSFFPFTSTSLLAS